MPQYARTVMLPTIWAIAALRRRLYHSITVTYAKRVESLTIKNESKPDLSTVAIIGLTSVARPVCSQKTVVRRSMRPTTNNTILMGSILLAWRCKSFTSAT